MRRLLSVFCLVALFAQTHIAHASSSKDFDFYVLSLSWTPNWCAERADGEEQPVCNAGRRLGFALDGFWPSFERGSPSYCLQGSVAPTRNDAQEMTDIMRSEDWAWHQWKKHGSCTGLEGREYFRAARQAYDSVFSPPSLNHINHEVEVPLKAIQDTMLMINPYIKREGITVTCRKGRMQEVRICLDKNLMPTECSHEIRRGCEVETVNIAPLR